MHTYNAKVMKWLEPRVVALEIDLGFRVWKMQTVYVEHPYTQAGYSPGSHILVHTQMEKTGRDHKYHGILTRCTCHCSSCISS